MPLERRGWDPLWLAKALADPARPVFLLGSVPPREGTSSADAYTICEKFVARSRCQATDGFIVYDIQDEASRTSEARPFPFRRTMDPSEFAALFPPASGKSVVVYKAVSEPSEAAFDKWLDTATVGGHGHRTLNLVGPASASDSAKQIPLAAAATRVGARGESLAFGCVTIAERHVAKGREHLNILRKQALGAQWFISQAVYDAEATVRLVRDYASECERTGVRPAKIILTFAPCGRPKTMQFIRWLGIQVPEAVESRVLKAAVTSRECAVNESIVTCCEALTTILEAVGRCGVPLGISVESVSGFREEIDGCFELFRRLQQILLDSHVGPWGVRWYRIPLGSLARVNSEEELAKAQARITDEAATKTSVAAAPPDQQAGDGVHAPPLAGAATDALSLGGALQPAPLLLGVAIGIGLSGLSVFAARRLR